MKRFAFAICGLLLCVQTGLVSAQALQRHPDVGQPLDARWRWGQEQVVANTAWVVWQFQTALDEKTMANAGFGFRHSGLSLDALLAGNTNRQQDFATPRRLALLAQFRDGELMDIETVDMAQPLPIAGPVYWLGEATSTASYRLLVSMLDTDLSVRLNRGLIRAIALHNHSERTAFLNSLLTTTAWAEYRRPILIALTLQHSTEVETLLLQIAADANQDIDERRIAVSGLRHYGSDASLALLVDLTAAGQPRRLRQEAAESLAWFNPDQVINTLQQLAWFDDSNDVREEAIASLSQLHSNNANALILDIARDHPSPSTRQEALQKLQDELF